MKNKSPHVLILFSSSQLGGAEKSLSRMAFVSEDIKFTLGTIDKEGPWCEWVRLNKFEPKVYGSFGWIWGVLNIFRDIRLLSFDVVYLSGLRISLLLRLIFIFAPKIKLVHGVRWNPISNSKLDKIFRIVERNFSWLVDGWIVNSKTTKNTLVTRCNISDKKIFVIYNGVDVQLKPTPINHELMKILTVANYSHRKGHIEYLKIIEKVVNEIPNVRFIFVGRDDMQGLLQQTIHDYGLSAYISCEGFQANVSKYYQEAMLFVLPSLWGEGSPTSILEAFSFSIPVVAYNIDGIPELLSNNEDGIILDVNKFNEAERIIELLKDPNKLTLMGENGRTKIITNFSMKNCANNHSEVIRELSNY